MCHKPVLQDTWCVRARGHEGSCVDAQGTRSDDQDTRENTTGYVDRFDEVLAEMSALHSKKGADYGGTNDPYANVRASAEFGIAPWVGALVRLNDKITRLKSFLRRGKLENESVEDSIQDIAVYAIIMRILYDEREKE